MRRFSPEFPPRRNRSPPAFIPQTPFCGRTKYKNKLVSVLRKSKSPENSFRKTESTESALRIPSVSPLGETRPRLPPPYQKKKTEITQKQNRMRGGEARAERLSIRSRTRSQRVLERMLSRDGIRRGACDYISNYHARGA